ncbi:MAG: ATP-dependent DNA helicase RecG, partial [Rhodomicrobium sp.]
MSDTLQLGEAPWHGRELRSSPGRMTLPKPDEPSAPAATLGEEGLYAPLKSLSGLGARGEELLTKVLAKPLSPPRVIDLLWHLPAGYIDRRLSPSIATAAPGGIATLLVRPVKYSAPPKGAARAPLRVVSEDESGSLDIVFFHGGRDAVKRLLPLNEPRLVSGRVEKYGARFQMAHPDYILTPAEAAKLPAIEPIYPLTLGLTQKLLYRVMGGALARLPEFAEWLDASLVEAEGWPSFSGALHLLHRPQSPCDIALWPKARERLGFDEVFSAQLAIALVRRGYRQLAGRSLVGDGHLAQKMRATLPYRLTRSQEQALAEIKADMAAPRRMLRLLQGDVGAGKTVVAALAMAATVEAGAQAAIMAPTDV